MTLPNEKPAICVLHPGKTGGTYLKSLIRHNKSAWTRPIRLMNHRETLATTARDFGPGRKLAFTFRDPVERFVSAFQSRRRQGRPTYNRMWSAAEATSFLFFDTPNDLAEALDSSDERIKSAAYFAFHSIIHLRINYTFQFDNVQRLADETGNILACIDVRNLDKDLPGFLCRLGIENATIPVETGKHANPEAPEPLSEHALRNLGRFWAREFEFYAAFREIETSLAR